MKRFLLIWTSTILATSFPYLSSAQQAVPTPNAPHASTTPWPDKHSRVAEVKKLIGNEYLRINKALKAGQISQSQATTLNGNVLAAYNQMQKDFIQNNIHGLTETQENQIKVILQQASQAIDTALGATTTATPATN